MSKEFTPTSLFEEIAGSKDAVEVPWEQCVEALTKRYHVDKSATRGFKRFLTDKLANGKLVVKKPNFVEKLSKFSTIFISPYKGGDIANGNCSLTW